MAELVGATPSSIAGVRILGIRIVSCCCLGFAVLVVSLFLGDGQATNNNPVLENSRVDAVGPR